MRTRNRRQTKRRRNAKHNQNLGNWSRASSSGPPIRLLVPDVLVQIFALATLEEDEEFDTTNWNRTAPVNVAAVCRHWRAVALASPNLWSTFRCSYSHFSGFPWRQLADFLQRADQATLDMKLHLRHDVAGEYTKLWTVVSDNQSRIKRVDVVSESDEFDMNPPTLTNLPALEEIRLRHIATDSYIHLDLSHAHRLKVLHLDGCIHLQLSRGLVLRSLVYIELISGAEGFTSHDCLMLFEASPSVEVFLASRIFIVASPNPSVNRASDGTHLEPSRLSTLGLAEVDPLAAHHILDRLRLSGLKELNLHLSYHNTDLSILGPLLSRSEPVLEKFDFDGLNVVDVVRGLDFLPGLRHLTVSESTNSLEDMSSMLAQLTLISGAGLCPNIESIEFKSCFSLYESFEELGTMIRSRWERASVGDNRCLKIVTFSACIESDDLPGDLPRYREQGLEIVVTGFGEESEGSGDSGPDYDSYDIDDDSDELYIATYGYDQWDLGL